MVQINNQIINKVFLPKTLLGALFFCGTLGTTMHMAKETIKDKGYIENSDVWLISLTYFAFACFCFVMYTNYKKGTDFSAHLARKYLKRVILKHPEFKLFEDAIYNDKVMANVATFISNSLRKSEQKRIIEIVSSIQKIERKYEDNFTEQELSLVWNNACNKIIKIFKEHASVHPEFIRDLYKIISYQDMIYMPCNPIQQHTK